MNVKIVIIKKSDFFWQNWIPTRAAMSCIVYFQTRKLSNGSFGKKIFLVGKYNENDNKII